MAEYKPRNYRLVRHVTRSRILDVRDCLDIGKLRIELVEFEQGGGARAAVEHYAEPDAIALLCWDVLNGRPWEKYVEFKGGPKDGKIVSRVLCIERVEARNPVKISVSRGPGEQTGAGAVKPAGKPEVSIGVLLSEQDARRIAFSILRHLAAWETATYHARVAAGTRQAEPDPEIQPDPEPEPEPQAEPPPERRKPHWTDDAESRTLFANICSNLRVSPEEVCAWLGNPISAAGRTYNQDVHIIRQRAAERGAKRAAMRVAS